MTLDFFASNLLSSGVENFDGLFLVGFLTDDSSDSSDLSSASSSEGSFESSAGDSSESSFSESDSPPEKSSEEFVLFTTVVNSSADAVQSFASSSCPS